VVVTTSEEDHLPELQPLSVVTPCMTYMMPSINKDLNDVETYGNHVQPQFLLLEFAEHYSTLAPLVGGKVMSCVELKDSVSVKEDTPEGVIKTPPKMYRPPLPSLYQEPVLGSDLNDGMEWMFQDGGKALKRTVKELLPRDDVVLFDAKKNTAELEKNLCLDGCPEELKPEVISLVKEYWDVFCKEGLKNPIRGFSFQIDMGDSPPVCCKTPRYGPHKALTINKLIKQLEAQGLIEDDEGPWGALIVLAAKPHQEEVP